MSYLVLARKYRPQTFNEIVGQEHITKTIKNALKTAKVWHAYIFAGMRGTGKTTTARILAKIVNCLSPTEDFEPCNKCQNCTEITQGSSVDVVEIDAASNRGIDDIRSLRESVKYVPVSCKYKVYIIDEAHQLTEAGFNALLKTLEEPPPYVIFILATTDFNALPLTIVSRCQTFHFRPVPQNILFERLKYVVKQENKEGKITDDALLLLAEASTGSVRDALSLLDQIMSFTEIYDVVDYNLVRSILGYTPTEVVQKIVELITEGDLKKLIDCVNEFYFTGIDLLQLSKDLLEFFHSLLYLKCNCTTTSCVYNVETFKDKFSVTQLIVIIQQIARLVEEVKRTEYPKTIFELYMVRLTKQYVEIDELVKSLSVQSTMLPDISLPAYATTYIEKETKSVDQQVSTMQQPPSEGIDITTVWDKILQKIKEEKPLSFASLAESEVTYCDNTITIFLPNKYVLTHIEAQNLPLEKMLEELTGKKIKVCYQIKQQKKLVFGETGKTEEAVVTQEVSKKVVTLKPKKEQQVDPIVEKICSVFSGKIVEQKKKEQE